MKKLNWDLAIGEHIPVRERRLLTKMCRQLKVNPEDPEAIGKLLARLIPDAHPEFQTHGVNMGKRNKRLERKLILESIRRSLFTPHPTKQ